jgi:hypothetical protein
MTCAAAAIAGPLSSDTVTVLHIESPIYIYMKFIIDFCELSCETQLIGQQAIKAPVLPDLAVAPSLRRNHNFGFQEITQMID